MAPGTGRHERPQRRFLASRYPPQPFTIDWIRLCLLCLLQLLLCLLERRCKVMANRAEQNMPTRSQLKLLNNQRRCRGVLWLKALYRPDCYDKLHTHRERDPAELLTPAILPGQEWNTSDQRLRRSHRDLACNSAARRIGFKFNNLHTAVASREGQ